MTSRKYYEMELQKLNASLLEMGEMIRMAIGGAVTALLEFDHDKAREIIAYDEQIDRQNREIEQQCYTLLLSQQPVAGDLRMVSAALKMTTDMERIGDHAADISEIELMLEKLPTLNCQDDSPDGDGDERDAHQEPGSVCPARRRKGKLGHRPRRRGGRSV
ncbi:MAG: phosphate signaling complex PhoU family protein [Christensenellales bacterium]